MSDLRDLFNLDPEIIFLNHGSFGATPQPVFKAYQAWQRLMEMQPVEFLGRRAKSLMEAARASLATYLGVEADEVVYFPNPTTALNMVARNLCKDIRGQRSVDGIVTTLRAGDEILTTDHEYGALNRTWGYICQQTGARYIQRTIPLPLENPESFVERFWNGVSEHTRVIFLSHITSPTALIFPVKEICQRARQAGILSIVDGAHAPGQISLELRHIGADIYCGACHKWLCAPKGAAFLYVRREMQSWLDPLIVSWGYESESPSNSQFVDYHEWQGTRDLASFLSVPAAIEFQTQHDWERVRKNCHELAVNARRQLNKLLEQESICSGQDFNQMFSVRLPERVNTEELKKRLYEEYAVEVPVVDWNNMKLLRVSIQGYNTPADIQVLLKALEALV